MSDAEAHRGSESPDRSLGYDLQFRGLEQIGNIGVGGAGLTITLVGGLLKNMGPFVWLATIEFALAAILALSAQWSLINEVAGKPTRPNSARYSGLAGVLLIGMGIGTLAASIFLSP